MILSLPVIKCLSINTLLTTLIPQMPGFTCLRLYCPLLSQFGMCSAYRSSRGPLLSLKGILDIRSSTWSSSCWHWVLKTANTAKMFKSTGLYGSICVCRVCVTRFYVAFIFLYSRFFFKFFKFVNLGMSKIQMYFQANQQHFHTQYKIAHKTQTHFQYSNNLLLIFMMMMVTNIQSSPVPAPWWGTA